MCDHSGILFWHTVQIRSGIRLAYGPNPFWHTVGIRSKSVLAYGWHTVGIRQPLCCLGLAYGPIPVWHTAGIRPAYGGIRSRCVFGIRSGSAAPRQEFLQLAEVSKVCGLAVYLWFHKDISDFNIQN